MALIVNGTTIPETNDIVYNGTALTKIVFNGVTVWKKDDSKTLVDVGIYIMSNGASFDNPGYDEINVYLSTFDSNFVKIKAQMALIIGDYDPYEVNLTLTPNAQNASKTILVPEDKRVTLSFVVFRDADDTIVGEYEINKYFHELGGPGEIDEDFTIQVTKA
jgi:hypothetical protein